MSETTHYQKNKDAIINKPKKYHHNNIEFSEKEQEINIESFLNKKKNKKKRICKK